MNKLRIIFAIAVFGFIFQTNHLLAQTSSTLNHYFNRGVNGYLQFAGSGLTHAKLGAEFTDAAFRGRLTVNGVQFYIQNKYTGKYLSLKSLNGNSGNDVVQWSSAGAYQRWQMIPVPNENGYFYLVNAQTGRLATSTGTGNGANVDQGVFRVENRKKVRLVKRGNYYQIIFKNSNRALDVQGFSKSNAASVKQYSANSSFGGKRDSQLWIVQNAGIKRW